MSINITVTFIIITCIASYIGFKNTDFLSKWVNWPYRVKHNKEYTRLLSSGFVHADFIHLLVNVFVLYQFGTIVELYYMDMFGSMGRNYYIMLLLLGIIVPDSVTYLKQSDNPNYRSLGASGAVSAVLFAYVLINPWSKIYLYGIIPLTSLVAAVLYLVYSIWADRKGGDNVNHIAHISGALFGFVFTIFLKPDLWDRFKSLVVNAF